MSDTWRWLEILIRTRSITFIAQNVISCNNCLFRNGWNLYCNNLQIILVLPTAKRFGPSNLVQKKVMLTSNETDNVSTSTLTLRTPSGLGEKLMFKDISTELCSTIVTS